MAADHNDQPLNFHFLAEHDSLFVELAASAERAFSSDPNTTLIKLRQLGEALAQDIAARVGLELEEKTSQADLLYLLHQEIRFSPEVRQLFHTLRHEGNIATHQFRTQHKEALDGLKMARELAVWYHQSFGKQGTKFKPGRFKVPSDPSKQLQELQEEIEKIKGALTDANSQLTSSQQLNDLIQQEKDVYEALAHAMDEESQQLAQQAKVHEQALEKQQLQYEGRLAELQKQIKEQSEKDRSSQRKQVTKKTRSASQNISLSEELTRILIDQQLVEAGWEADTQDLTWEKGARPEKDKNKAIAECPTRFQDKKGRADYVLFRGLTPIAVVEAKKENTDVAGKIPQAERYSKGFKVEAPIKGAWEMAGRTIAWPDEKDGHYQIPFVYSCNGRPYIKQLETQSGTWFRDVRQHSNLAKALKGFHSPDGLSDLLKRSKEKSEQKLQQEGFSYLRLRDYQEMAIKAVESTLAQGINNALLAMATGTGKTHTIIGLMYRFLKTERFKRILFLVDRTALGDQALVNFKEAPLEQNQSLSTIYNIAELGDMAVEAETRIQMATVQAMVQRIFASDTPPPVDNFDCIIVDEAHRGYTLDQEMTEGEMSTRDASQYLSSYRRALDYFDAVKIGLTATPAKHTSEIFGRPVYTYSYREAVADDWLIDHEPPIRYITELTEQGIHFKKGETVSAINTQTGEVVTEELEDEMSFDVDAFNRTVITPGFNKAICEQLAQELVPFGPEKTMIFCVTDRHADMVKEQLDKEFKVLYGNEYKQAAVAKITGQSDKVGKLISRFKNETNPNIAITVDLLSTGIDVPEICNIVFLRRVKSRILYEQMVGRATRRCDEIGKTVFRIYDPVDIYAALSEASTMKPLVKNPKITMEQLVDELADPNKLEMALNSPGEQKGESQADTVLSQLGQKLMRVLRKAEKKAENNPELKSKLDELQELWGVEPKKLHTHLRSLGPRKASEFINQHSRLLNQMDEVSRMIGSEYRPIIAMDPDQVKERIQNYGEHKRPEDYLESFNDFIKQQLNESAALAIVVNRPRDLTRQELKDIKLLLDQAGYSEAKLQAAVRNQTNQDIAASIIGHIRRAALGETLISFEQRVASAMEKLYGSHPWSPAQRKWLSRLAKQLVHEVIIDQQFVNERFSDHGGAKQLNRILGERLNHVLEQLNDAIWPLKTAG